MAKIKESKATYSAEPITVVTARGQTAIPRALRERYHVAPKSRLRWIDKGEGLLIVPLEQPAASKVSKWRGSAPSRGRKFHATRPENLEAIAILREWMQESDDWTSEQWGEFEHELRTRRFSLRKPA
jgi:bifunctional DNA-binding transcriptional regulator/antitoxin component of YhaV-PrlF toxin-antitoxin module